ncbi:hypothetical protein [Candidatus Uabimicrobium sp. HlEnr_7]|uniref:hypothetical protein n=1 Tax=Candidatus Uabimicrobium helgolandensis TaxID=3095367 RepID=UPI003558342F
MKYNKVEIKNTFPENESGYSVYEVSVDENTFFAAKNSKHGTWKVCDEQDVSLRTKQVPVVIEKKMCNIQLISLLERMVLAKTTVWAGPLAVILR